MKPNERRVHEFKNRETSASPGVKSRAFGRVVIGWSELLRLTGVNVREKRERREGKREIGRSRWPLHRMGPSVTACDCFKWAADDGPDGRQTRRPADRAPGVERPGGGRWAGRRPGGSRQPTGRHRPASRAPAAAARRRRRVRAPLLLQLPAVATETRAPRGRGQAVGLVNLTTENWNCAARVSLTATATVSVSPPPPPSASPLRFFLVIFCPLFNTDTVGRYFRRMETWRSFVRSLKLEKSLTSVIRIFVSRILVNLTLQVCWF